MERHHAWTLLIALILVSAIGMASAIPGIPPTWYGNVTINGSAAPDGTIVSGWIGGVEKVSQSITGGGYLINVGGSTGDDIVLKIHDSVVETVPYQNDPTEKHLSLNDTEVNTSAQPAALPARTTTTFVLINWTTNPGSDTTGLSHYELLRATNAGGPFSSINVTSDTTQTTHNDTGLSNGDTYYYILRTYDKVGNNETNTTTVNTTIDTGAGATTKFVILDPTDGTIDAPITVTVQAQDAAGNVNTSYQTNVTLVTNGSATGAGVVDITNGVGTLDISDTVAETVNLSLTDSEGTGLDNTSTQDVVFGLGATTKFVILDPTDGTIDAPITVTVQAQDAAGNVNTSYQTNVTLVTNGSATGAGVVDITNGVGTLDISDTVAETVNLSLTDSEGTGLDNTSTQDVVFGLGATTKFVILDPTDGTVDAPITVTVQAQDAAGDVDTSYQTNVTLVTNGSATGAGVVDITNGVGTLDISDTVAETVNLSLTDSEGTGLDNTSTQDVVFGLGATTKFVILDPTDGTIDAPITVTVQAQDAAGNVNTSYQTNVTLVTNGSATGAGVVDITNGVGTLDISDTVAETVNLSLTDSEGTGLDNTSTQDVVFGLGATTKFVILDPIDGTIDAPITVTVQAQDAAGDVDTSYQTNVTLVTNGSATGAGVVDITNGVGTLDISDTVAETVNLSLTDSEGTGLDNTSTQDVVFGPGATTGAPNITSRGPTSSPVSDTAGATRAFNITVNQTVTATWYINGTLVGADADTTTATYMNTSAAAGVWNVSAVVTNANGDDMETWIWNVTVASAHPCTCGDICVNQTGWWRDGSAFNGSGTPIQTAVNNASGGDTICVAAGSYGENVNIGTAHLTLAGEGADVVTVTAPAPDGDHVFNVTADYVNISAFNVTGATGDDKAGIYLNGASHCNISDNNASGNVYGIYLYSSSNNNTLSSNTANSNNAVGIKLVSSSNNNTLTSNAASNNGDWDVWIESSSSTFTDNTLNGTTVSFTYGGNVSLKGEGSPAADPTGRHSIGKFINATNQSADAWLYLNFSYSDSDVSGLAESGLAVWKYNGTDWVEGGWNGTRYLSTVNNVVGVNITTFSVFAPTVAAAYIPPAPTNLNNTTGNYWVNYTWSEGSGPDNGNVTDSFNVCMNGTWTNETADTFMNVTAGPSGWANITVWAYNASGAGTLSGGSVSDTVQAPAAAAPAITSWSNNKTDNNSLSITVNESESVRFNATANQTIDTWHWHNNGTFVQSNNFDNCTASWSVNGTHNVSVNATNANGTSSPVMWTITVNDIRPPAPVTGLVNDTPTTSTVNLSWTANTEADLVGYRVYRNGTLIDSTANAYYNATGLLSSTAYEFNVSAYDDHDLEGENASIVVTTAVGPFHHIDVMPTSWTMNDNESRNFTATGRDQNEGKISGLVFAWSRSDAYIGSLTEINDTTTNFTAEHVGITYLTASNGSVTSGQVQVTVNAPTNNTTVSGGTATATSGNSTATVKLNNESVNGTIAIKELGDPLNSTTANGSTDGLGTGVELIKGVNITASANVTGALANDTNRTSWIHIKIEYNESRLGTIDENTLFIYKYVNGSGWVKLVSGSNNCTANGRNTTANYIWANVTHLCDFGLGGSAPSGSNGGSTSGGDGTYPPGWFGTPSLGELKHGTPTPSLGERERERVTPTPTKAKPAASKAAAPAAEGTTAGDAKKSAPGFTAVFAIAGMLAFAYVMMRRRG